MSILRRNKLYESVPAELAIRAAVDAVEVMGADVRLTQAVILLDQARERVADFVDGVSAIPQSLAEDALAQQVRDWFNRYGEIQAASGWNTRSGALNEANALVAEVVRSLRGASPHQERASE